jgi:carbonic anhydrase/acetyltransferase-like protein (isoleucine patch superfamily)
MRSLRKEEIVTLTNQGCTAEDWSNIQVADLFSPQYINNVEFYGNVTLGYFQKDVEVAPGFTKHSGIRYATLRNVVIGNDCLIEHVGIINTTTDATFGQGQVIAVLNEVGDGNVMIFDGLNAQLASLMVKYEQDKEFTQVIRSIIQKRIDLTTQPITIIGNDVRITHTTAIVNCHISDGCQIDGALRLQDCTLKSMPDAVVKIGVGVICEHSVIYNGSSVQNNAKLENCFVGEACTITDGFTAESSLFFANCYMSNGEACAAFCGPFSASHHKSSLLIGGMFSFYNAGSATNFSNHAYKMGPMHWGILDRGTKTASGSYILMPAHIGTFSVCFGKLMHHPDTTKLPFSYLIAYGDEMYLVPGRNLTTVGLYRDIRKWPKRDKRPDEARNSIVNFDWLSPFSVGGIMVAKRTLEGLREISGDVATYNFHDYVIKNSSLKKGIKYYDIALRIYMGAVMKRHILEVPRSSVGTGKWSDLSGLLIPVSEEQRIKEAIKNGELDTIDDIRNEFVKANKNYSEYRWAWSYRLIREYYGIEGEITPEIAERVMEDYITARRAWIAEIRKDAVKEFELGDIDESVLNEFLEILDKEVEYERLMKYEM